MTCNVEALPRQYDKQPGHCECGFFKNALNSIRRDEVLSAVEILISCLLSTLHILPHPITCGGDEVVLSCEAVQHRDPIGPLVL